MHDGTRPIHDHGRIIKNFSMTTLNDERNVGDILPIITTDIAAFLKEVHMALTHSALLLPLGRVLYAAGMVLLFIGSMAGLGLANADMAVRMHELLAPLMALGSIAAEALCLAMNSSASSDQMSALSALSAVGIGSGLSAATFGCRLWERAVEKLPQDSRAD